jgi:hypothetical protein
LDLDLVFEFALRKTTKAFLPWGLPPIAVGMPGREFGA